MYKVENGLCWLVTFSILICKNWYQPKGIFRGRCGSDRMVVGFTTTHVTSGYHHKRCEFESRSCWGVLDTILCDKVCQWRATGRRFSPGTPISSTNKTDRRDITEILLKVALNTINQTKPVKFIVQDLRKYLNNDCMLYIW